MKPIQAPFVPNGIASALAAAQGLLRAGRLEEADRAGVAILSRDPSNVDALLIHGAASFRLGLLGEADRAIASVRALEPEHPGASMLSAEVLQARGSRGEALAEASRALAKAFGVSREPLLAAREMIDASAREPLARLRGNLPALQLFGTLLANAHTPPQASPILESAATSPMATRSGEEFAVRFAAAMALLGFSRLAAPEWNREVFERVILPWMRSALADGRLEEAFEIERWAYEVYVKQTESEAHFEECTSRWKDAMREAGARFSSTLAQVPRAAPGPLPRIAFFVHNVSGLAHVQMVLSLIEGHAQLPTPRFEPFVFCLTGQHAELERFRRAGAKVEVLFEASFRPGIRSALAILRQRIAQAGIDELVWVSLVVLMPFALAMRLAPAQAWWAMKYHSLELPEIDGYLTGGGLEGGTKSIGGRTWLAGPVASAEWTAPGKAEEAGAIRGTLGAYRIVYGCFGREEKLDSDEFLDAVARVLKAVPDAAFVWTGRTRHPPIQRRLEAAGVAERCHYIGWVDTKLYAQVIDVFLDSFPFPCGFTLYEAMAAGKPVVLFANAASAHTGVNALLGPLLDEGDPGREAARLARSIFRREGEDLCLRAMNPDQYVELAVRVGTDDGLRARSGAACRQFVERFLADRARAATIYADHFETILAAAGKRAPA